MRITRESAILVAICVADLVTTVWFVARHGAVELNPVMNFYLQLGYLPFILAKCVLFIGPLAVLEWARRYRPRFVRTMLRSAIALYLTSYGIVVWHTNQAPKGTMSREEEARIIAWSEARPTPMEIAEARALIRTTAGTVTH